MLVSGLWFFAWAFFGLRNLGERHKDDTSPLKVIIKRSFVDLGRTISRTARDSRQARYLAAVSLYTAAIGTTLLIAPTVRIGPG